MTGLGGTGMGPGSLVPDDLDAQLPPPLGTPTPGDHDAPVGQEHGDCRDGPVYSPLVHVPSEAWQRAVAPDPYFPGRTVVSLAMAAPNVYVACSDGAVFRYEGRGMTGEWAEKRPVPGTARAASWEGPAPVPAAERALSRIGDALGEYGLLVLPPGLDEETVDRLQRICNLIDDARAELEGE